MSPNFQNGKIYKIYSLSNENLVYYGATVQLLSRRKAEHIYRYREGILSCSSKIIFESCEDYRIELVELYPCNSRIELDRREGYYIKNNECVNKIISGRTKKEYRFDNKISIAKSAKIYNDEHKEERRLYDKKRQKIRIICECGRNISKKQYPDHIKTTKHKNIIRKIYQEENIYFNCVLCGYITKTKEDFKRHCSKTKKHDKNKLLFFKKYSKA